MLRRVIVGAGIMMMAITITLDRTAGRM